MLHWMLLVVYIFPLGTVSVSVTGNHDLSPVFCEEARQSARASLTLVAVSKDELDFSGAGGKQPDAYLCLPRNDTDGALWWTRGSPMSR
jgi:hypothetical protein